MLGNDESAALRSIWSILSKMGVKMLCFLLFQCTFTNMYTWVPYAMRLVGAYSSKCLTWPTQETEHLDALVLVGTLSHECGSHVFSDSQD